MRSVVAALGILAWSLGLAQQSAAAQNGFDSLPTYTVVFPAQTLPSRYFPAQHFPAQHYPARHYPAQHYPARKTTWGVIPAVDIPAVDIPAVDIPAVDFPATVIPETRIPEMRFEVPDYAKIRYSDLRRYASTMPRIAATPPPQKVERTPSTAVTVDLRGRLFVARYPHATASLVALFASADTNGSGDLSWNELVAFQRSLYRRYVYRTNSTALRPDEFLAQGGGDCEDWALMTSALCDYWGWDAYVGCFFGSDGSGHALCMVKGPRQVPAGYTYWQIASAHTIEGDAVASGDYVPVDYDQVGMLSNAVGVDHTLRFLMTPAKIYGAAM